MKLFVVCVIFGICLGILGIENGECLSIAPLRQDAALHAAQVIKKLPSVSIVLCFAMSNLLSIHRN